MPVRDRYAPYILVVVGIILMVAAIGAARADVESGMQALAREDYSVALNEFTKTARAGDQRAQYQLGLMYANGDGVPQDFAAAAKWFRLAADRGYASAREGLRFLASTGMVPAEAAKGTALYIQLATTASKAEAEQEWRRLQKVHTEIVGTLTASVESFDGGQKGTLYRVLSGPHESEKAKDVCGKLRAANNSCYILRR